MNIVTRFNKWLDSKEESLRFIIVILMMCAWLCPLQLGLIFEITNLIIIGIIGLVITIFVAMNRIIS